ncbi:UNVERIFIED_CONTAM: Zinc finger CCCH domain-containing protein 39 [Sesamum indicum]
MQNENVSFDALTTTTTSAAASAPLYFSRSNPFLSPTSPSYLNSSASFYSSLFQNYSPNSISDTASFDGGDTERRLHDASCILEYQQLYNRYTLCLSQLHDSIEEVDALRRENDSLRVSNADLSHRVALLFSRDRLLSEFNRLNIASPSSAVPLPVHVASPQPLIEHNRVERINTERVSLPKSISVRSRGYLKMTRPGRDTSRHKTVSEPCPASVSQLDL